MSDREIHEFTKQCTGIPRSPCRFHSMRGCVLCWAPAKPAEGGSGACEWGLVAMVVLGLETGESTGLHAGARTVASRLWAPASVRGLGPQEAIRPRWMQVGQGKVPVHRRLEILQEWQAMLARRRLAGSTLGRGMAGNSGAFWVNLSDARIETVKSGVSIEFADCINSGRHPTRRSVICCLRQRCGVEHKY